MKNTIPISLLCLSLVACYKQISLDGFNKEKWVSSEQKCDNYRLDIVDYIVKNQEVLLQATQNEVESLLGKASEHELYQRNQKFFHYRLSPPLHCGDYKAVAFLSIRFNAIGRANLIQVMLREPSS